MTTITTRGYEIKIPTIKDSYNRRAIQFQNNIIEALKIFGLNEDDVEIPLQRIGFARAPAEASWYFDGYYLHFTYNQQQRFIDNLFVVSQVIQKACAQVSNKEITVEEFIKLFNEEEDITKLRTWAREKLGVANDCKDLEEINRKYKELAKKSHPDTASGSTEEFKEVNKAHKILKRELS